MTEFTRYNELVLSAKFTPVPGQIGSPSAAEVRISYLDLSGSQRSVNIPLTLSEDGVTWTCVWDTTNAGPGHVDWTARCWGGLVASTEGNFHIRANASSRS